MKTNLIWNTICVLTEISFCGICRSSAPVFPGNMFFRDVTENNINLQCTLYMDSRDGAIWRCTRDYHRCIELVCIWGEGSIGKSWSRRSGRYMGGVGRSGRYGGTWQSSNWGGRSRQLSHSFLLATCSSIYSCSVRTFSTTKSCSQVQLFKYTKEAWAWVLKVMI